MGADEDRGKQRGNWMRTENALQNALLNGGELMCGGGWTDRWIGRNRIERVGVFDVEGSEDVKEVPFRAIIILGKTPTRKPRARRRNRAKS